MNHNILSITDTLSDDAILGELGQRLSRYRIDANLTQQALAEKAGISKSTLERIEAGAPSQLPNLIRVLRALEMLSLLDVALPPLTQRPMALLRNQRKLPQRVRSRKLSAPGQSGQAGKAQKSARGSADDNTSPAPWVWGDERQ